MNKFIEKVEAAIWGQNGQSGLIGSDRRLGHLIESKISRAWLIGTALTIVAILCVIFIPMVTGAVKTIRIVSDRSIAMQVTTDRTILDVAAMDLEHRRLVEAMDIRNREVHVTLLKQMKAVDSSISERMQKGNVELLAHFSREINELEDRIEKDIEKAIEVSVQKAFIEHEERDSKIRREEYDSIRDREIP